MNMKREPEKQLMSYIRRLTAPGPNGDQRADLRTLGDYSRRPLAGLLHNTISERRSGVQVEPWHVEVGLRDEPSTGHQPLLELDLGVGTVWFTGAPKSGKSHAMRCLLSDWTERYKQSIVIHLNGDEPSSAGRSRQSPVYFGNDDHNAQALVIRQIWARHFQQAGPFPVLLAIERVDLLLRALVNDERTYENLLDLLRDGVTRSVFCCVTAVQSREALLIGGAREISFARRPDSPLPYAQLDRGSWAMFYTDPAKPAASGPANACRNLGIPEWLTLQELGDRMAHADVEAHVPIGVDWQTHELVWVGGSSLAISGDSERQSVLQRLGQMFTAKHRHVVQLKGPRDPDYPSVGAASMSLDPANWTQSRITQITTETYGGVLVVPNIDTKADILSQFSGTVASMLSTHGWIVVASAANAGATLFENATARTRYLSTYSQCLWLRTLDRGSISTHGGPDRFPVWPRPVREDLGDAFLLRTDGYAQTIRMPVVV